MLRKLLKYDLRSNMKIYLFIWPAIVVFGLLERLVIGLDLTGTAAKVLVNTTTTLYVLAVIAACVFALVVSVVRFYSGLLRDEGYLMFTLPVKPWQLVLSKLLTAMLTIAVTVVLSVLSALFLLGGIDGFWFNLRNVFTELNTVLNALSYVLVVVLVLAALGMSVTQVYLSCALGHLFRRHRIVCSVLAYYLINVLLEALFVNSLILLESLDTGGSLYHQVGRLLGGLSTTAQWNVLLGIVAIGFLAVGVLFYFLTERILRKHLNLE